MVEARDQALMRLVMSQQDPEWSALPRYRQLRRAQAALQAWYAAPRETRMDLFVKLWVRRHPHEED